MKSLVSAQPAAKAILARNGLKEGDYTIDQLDMGQHVNVMQAGTFDAGYTLEPNASTMRKMGIASTIEAGVIAHYVLGDPNANAFVGGCALTTDFIKNRPDVAKRFTAAWEKAVRLINENPKEARKHLLKNTFTPDDVVDTVPMIRYFMTKDLSDKDKADYQKFIDFSVQTGTLTEKVDPPNISRRSDKKAARWAPNPLFCRSCPPEFQRAAPIRRPM